MEKNQIFIKTGTKYKKMTRELLEESNLAELIGDKNKMVGIKPNLVSPSDPANGGTTHPEIVAGILEYLMLNQGRPVSQEELIEHVWDSTVNSFSNATRVHISSLRKKLRSTLGYDPIRNRIGEGYVMEDSE